MSRRCDICARGPRTTIDRSHAMNITKRRVFVNLQSQKVNGVRRKVCTSCLKTQVKVKN